ncbi:IclR family transcriptional regulator [Gluconacetobacter tumulisoli]|uniref:IclR family transcriptional regulator n=1 Tax=Gluconacetobacter tumulisoli TaxID=1286189 RepID=A0A7W4K6M5_9PROT|nr:IclR family transcriptional regulator [Gluconacetobacter tumulisoli]MBB2201243.1 IclR family transcriptional regulator [Gluconacetobacter tumulisoli]
MDARIAKPAAPSGTQALERGIAIIDAVDGGHRTLSAIAGATGCTRSTTQRIASSLVRLDWLRLNADGTYRLGQRLAALGARARDDTSLAEQARPVTERLGAETRDTVHLGIRSGADVLYLDKIPGQRGLEMRSRVGQRMNLALTGIGRALMLDLDEVEWRHLYDAARPPAAGDAGWPAWLARMREYRAADCVFDLEDNEVGIRCVAVPVRDRGGRILAALSVASATPYLSPERMRTLAPVVRRAADDLSIRLGGSTHVTAA